MRTNPRKLRNLLINPRYQFKYIAWINLAGALLIALNSTIFYIFTRENYKILVDLSPMNDDVKVQLHSELNHIILYMVLASIAILGVLNVLGLILTHKTAGPLYHFKRIFEEIRQGKQDARIRLRPSDDFQDVANSCNQMLDTVLSARMPKG